MSPVLDIAQFREPELLNLPVSHLSASALAMARRCPRQYRQRYILGRKERPGEAPVVGSAVHAGLERNFIQKIQSHQDLPVADLLDWFMDEGFVRTCFEEQEIAGEEIKWDTDPDAARRRGQAMLGQYRNEVAPRIQPIAVESEVTVDFDLPVPVVGRFDLMQERTTLDWKTGKQKRTTPKEDWRIQAAIYGEATRRGVEFHSISASPRTNAVSIVTPLEAPALLVHPTESERREIRRTIHAIAAEISFYMNTYGPDEEWPTHGRFHVWACDFCGFRNDCPAWEDE